MNLFFSALLVLVLTQGCGAPLGPSISFVGDTKPYEPPITKPATPVTSAQKPPQPQTQPQPESSAVPEAHEIHLWTKLALPKVSGTEIEPSAIQSLVMDRENAHIYMKVAEQGLFYSKADSIDWRPLLQLKANPGPIENSSNVELNTKDEQYELKFTRIGAILHNQKKLFILVGKDPKWAIDFDKHEVATGGVKGSIEKVEVLRIVSNQDEFYPYAIFTVAYSYLIKTNKYIYKQNTESFGSGFTVLDEKSEINGRPLLQHWKAQPYQAYLKDLNEVFPAELDERYGIASAYGDDIKAFILIRNKGLYLREKTSGQPRTR